MNLKELFHKLDIPKEVIGGFWGKWQGSGKEMEVVSPIDGATIEKVTTCQTTDVKEAINAADEAFKIWRLVPAPKRGLIVKELGREIENNAEELAQLITLEMGKPIKESRGEVQEMVDICDFALGLSRQLYGLTMPSERHLHRLQEQWFPLGVVGIVTAFNFPAAVWSWNVALALVCGNSVLWKPSSKTPLTAIACTKMAERVLSRHNHPTAICSLVTGRGSEIGDLISKDKNVALVSYTGSVSCGRHVGKLVQERFGRLILELGGNNAVIVSEKGNLNLAIQSVYFGAVGTAGQRCTTTRRVIVHSSIYEDFLAGLQQLYEKTAIGNPLDEKFIMGPLVNEGAVETMLQVMVDVKKEGGTLLWGGQRLMELGKSYIAPAVMKAKNNFAKVQEETFAPILYVMQYDTIEEAIAIQNDVPQGLSSAIITNDLRESELFLSAQGSDCGIANVNAGTSGAEIGGAFGGEKETGGGRESGSDSWKAYMRRQTNAINFSGGMELAQDIELDLT